MEKNRSRSVKSNDILVARKSNISTQRPRPSICIIPTFISKSARGNKLKENNIYFINIWLEKFSQTFVERVSKSCEYFLFLKVI